MTLRPSFHLLIFPVRATKKYLNNALHEHLNTNYIAYYQPDKGQLMRELTSICFLLSSIAIAPTVWSKASNHCIQKSFSDYGDTITCFENHGLPQEQFSQLCSPPDNDLVRFEASYVEVCPLKPKGVCLGQKIQSGADLPYVAYIYKNDIAFLKRSCIDGGFKWLDNPKI